MNPVQSTPPSHTDRTPASIILNAVRGGLIALAELVPGVSGGTIALVVGVYEKALSQANALLHAARVAIGGRRRTPAQAAPATRKAAFAAIDWWFLLPIGVGMLVTVFLGAGVMHSFVEGHPTIARGLFMGMVLVSIAVPLRMVGRAEIRARIIPAALLFAVATLATFFATSTTAAEKTDPSLPVIFCAAAVAICALVLPGVSGSFFLLAVGLYGPVIQAVSERNVPVLITFAAGAATGLILFIRFLEYLLNRHRTLTLVTMSGLMLGSLRALWPWQGPNAELQAPGDNIGTVVAMFILGAALVAATLYAENRRTSRQGEAS